jgi:hypothetical protein
MSDAVRTAYRIMPRRVTRRIGNFSCHGSAGIAWVRGGGERHPQKAVRPLCVLLYYITYYIIAVICSTFNAYTGY